MAIYDIAVIGGGINGAGIARDAAGRGLRVALCEQDDLGSHTSSASSKMIHGGLRYLEYGALGMVRGALRERGALLRAAPHIIRPLRLVVPHGANAARPRWMVRLGLFLYDRLGGGGSLPGSRAVNLHRHPAGAALRAEFVHGFFYHDCRVQDARLVVLNAVDAAGRGADIFTRTRCTAAVRGAAEWRLDLAGRRTITARCLVNAGGPWVHRVLDGVTPPPPRLNLRLVAGGHIMVNRLAEHQHAYLLQNDDGRVVFVMPWEERWTLIGTTEKEFHGDPAAVRATDDEVDYLCAAVNRYFRHAIRPEDVVQRFAGVRPLFDAGRKKENASAVTREYHLDLNRDGAPLLSVYGGKLTTYRKLAEDAVNMLCPVFNLASRPWTRGAHLPGGDLGGDVEWFRRKVAREFSFLPESVAARWAQTYGSRLYRFAHGVKSAAGLGEDFGGGLSRREVDYLRAEEFAVTADDILHRRTALGLGASKAAVDKLQKYLAR